RKTDNLVEHRKRVPQSPICFLCDHMQSVGVKCYSFFRCYTRQMQSHILYAYTIKIKNLATGKNRCQYLMLLRGCQNKYGIGWPYVQRFQQRIESLRRKHMDLISHIYFKSSSLRWYPHLPNQTAYVINRIV